MPDGNGVKPADFVADCGKMRHLLYDLQDPGNRSGYGLEFCDKEVVSGGAGYHKKDIDLSHFLHNYAVNS